MDLDDNKTRWGQTVATGVYLPSSCLTVIPEQERGWGHTLCTTLPSNATLATTLEENILQVCKDISSLPSCKGLSTDPDVASASITDPGVFLLPLKSNAGDDPVIRLQTKVKRPQTFRWTKADGTVGTWDEFMELSTTEAWKQGALSFEIAVKFMLYTFEKGKGMTCHIASGMDVKQLGWSQVSMRVSSATKKIETDSGQENLAPGVADSFVPRRATKAFCTAEQAELVSKWATERKESRLETTIANGASGETLTLYNISVDGCVSQLLDEDKLSLQRTKYVPKPGENVMQSGGVNKKVNSITSFMHVEWPTSESDKTLGALAVSLGRCTLIRSQYERTKMLKTENGPVATSKPWSMLKYLDTTERYNTERDPPAEDQSAMHKILKIGVHSIYKKVLKTFFQHRVVLGQPREGDEPGDWGEALGAMKQKKFDSKFQEWTCFPDKDMQDQTEEMADEEDDAIASTTTPLSTKDDEVLTRFPVEDDTTFFELSGGKAELLTASPDKLWGDDGKLSCSAVVVLQPRLQVKMEKQKSKKSMVASMNEPRLTLKARCVIFTTDGDLPSSFGDYLPHKPSAPSFSGGI